MNILDKLINQNEDILPQIEKKQKQLDNVEFKIKCAIALQRPSNKERAHRNHLVYKKGGLVEMVLKDASADSDFVVDVLHLGLLAKQEKEDSIKFDRITQKLKTEKIKYNDGTIVSRAEYWQHNVKRGFNVIGRLENGDSIAKNITTNKYILIKTNDEQFYIQHLIKTGGE